MADFNVRKFREEVEAAGEQFFPGSKGMGMDAMSLAGLREKPLRDYGTEPIYRIKQSPAFGSGMSIRIILGDKISLVRVTPYVTEQYDVPDEYASDLKAVLRSIEECAEPPSEEVGFCDADAFLYESFTTQSHRYFKRHVRQSPSKVLPQMQRLWSLVLDSHPKRRNAKRPDEQEVLPSPRTGLFVGLLASVRAAAKRARYWR